MSRGHCFLLHQDEQRPSPEMHVGDEKKPLYRSVHFNEIVNVHLIIHVNDMDDQECIDTWYQEHDFAKMYADCRSTLRKLNAFHRKHSSDNAAATPPLEDICGRGLEHRTKRGFEQRSFNKRLALCVVMNEQLRQEAKCIMDDEAIRVVYMEANLHCQDAARLVGEYDELAATEILQEYFDKTRGKTKKSRRKKVSKASRL
mmetsp:Transcript_907/g.2200  ORF Transcript_907/g.2200 Transcript_907/m.2200 type:complete len:201 (+) Transcript_907:88-690(+)